MSEQEKTLVFDDLGLKRGFTQVPNIVLCDKRLADKEFRIYCLLLRYAWQDNECFPGQCRLADDLGCDKRTVTRLIQKLQRVKLIRIERRGQGQVNIYHIRKFTDGYTKSFIDKGVAG